MEIQSFKDFLLEKNEKVHLKVGQKFKTLDKTGDLADEELQVKSIVGKDIEVIILSSNLVASTTIDKLNIDPKSIK